MIKEEGLKLLKKTHHLVFSVRDRSSVSFQASVVENDNLYVYSMIKSATQEGYKCVVINFRGSAGVPLTSGKIYWFNSWQDLKEPIDYIHQKYCCTVSLKSSQTSKKNQIRGLYAYAVSLGGGILGLYLVKEGEKSPLNGVCGFGTPYALGQNVEFFRNTGFRFYDLTMGFNYY